MSFSYEDSLEPWKRATTESERKIRILELHPPPSYLRWLPRDLLFRVPLHASLEWAPLKPSISNKDHHRSTAAEEIYPTYKALSYTWGNNGETHDIFVNGRKLTITFSLAVALAHLRPISQPLKIWIDQICINQEDNEEKTEQVQFMDRIYRNCEEALVWLGPAADGSDALMDLFNKIATFANDFKLLEYYKPDKYEELAEIERGDRPRTQKSDKYHAFCNDITAEFTPAILSAMICFYKRPYFFRAWVVQEFSLPERVTIICGERTIQAEMVMVIQQMFGLTFTADIIRASPRNQQISMLLDTISNMNTLHPFFSSRQRRKAWDAKRIAGDGLYPMLQRICVEQYIQATQGTDLVYGLLGLVNDADKLGVKAIYLKDAELIEQGAFLVTESDLKKFDELQRTIDAGKDHAEESEVASKAKEAKKQLQSLMVQLQAALTYTQIAKAIILSGKVDLLTLAQHPKKDMNLPSWTPDWRSAIRQSFAYNAGSQNIDFTALAIARHLERNNALPSWVPDWRMEIKRSFAWLRDADAAPLFRASANQPPKFYPENDGRVLALEGYLVDSIEEVAGPWAGGSKGTHPEFPYEGYINYLSQVRQLCLLSKAKGADVYPDATRRDEAVWRVPVGDTDQDVLYNTQRATLSCKLRYDHCVAELELQMQVNGLSSLAEYERRAQVIESMGGTGAVGNNGSMYRIRMNEMKGKRPFLSKIGYVGMGPSYMSTGDVIVVLNGASVPFIVRPLEDRLYRFMGECYCDGIMDGEVVHKLAPEKIVLV